jgi:hypothetical protein
MSSLQGPPLPRFAHTLLPNVLPWNEATIEEHVAELKELEQDEGPTRIPNFSLTPQYRVDPTWLITFQGPEASPYSELTFTLSLVFPRSTSHVKAPFVFNWGPIRPLHPMFDNSFEYINYDPRGNETPKMVFLQIRKLLTLPKVSPRHTLVQKFHASPDDYFRKIAATHSFSKPVTPELLASWKQPQEIADKIYNLKGGLHNLSFIYSSLDVTWSPSTHKYFLCPKWRETVFTILTANTYYYGKNILGIPKPLILEILAYVAHDSFGTPETWIENYNREENLEKYFKTDWVYENITKLGDLRSIIVPSELLEVQVRNLKQDKFTYWIHPEETIGEFAIKFSKNERLSGPECMNFIYSGQILKLNNTLKSINFMPSSFLVVLQKEPLRNFWDEPTPRI